MTSLMLRTAPGDDRLAIALVAPGTTTPAGSPRAGA